jgi:GH24 family phage-related lysozyme (muramidase)
MNISSSGVQLIADFEGYSSRPYRDSVGVWTIGFGHTEGVGPGSRALTRSQAESLLRRDLDKKYAPYVAKLKLPLNQNQFDALVSFVYNLGPGYIYRGHTMGDALARHDWKAAANAFLIYDFAGGRRLLGLTRRRRAERELFLSPSASPTSDRDALKIAKWTAELNQIRRYIRRHGGHWTNHPIRWARAKRLKAAIARHSRRKP